MSKCQFCYKGSKVGNMVSHAKNRLKRLFKPNIHKLKVMLDGRITRVAFCTKCIKRLRKDGHLGNFQNIKYAAQEKAKISMQKKTEDKKTLKAIKTEKAEKLLKPSKEEPSKPVMSIEDIVGKKN